MALKGGARNVPIKRVDGTAKGRMSRVVLRESSPLLLTRELRQELPWLLSLATYLLVGREFLWYNISSLYFPIPTFPGIQQPPHSDPLRLLYLAIPSQSSHYQSILILDF